MTIPSTSRKAGPFSGDGVATVFPFTFKVFAPGDVAVTIANALNVETELVLNADYSVTLNPNQETSPGGFVTYPLSGSPLPTGSKLSIIGNISYDQPLDLPSGGNFSPLALENQLDRMVMQIQQLREVLNRTLRAPVTSNVDSALPSPDSNALIGWNSAETGLQNFPLSQIATALAFATYRHQPFTGDGVTDTFPLAVDPVTLGNTDVSLDGLVLTPGVDYTLVAGSIVTTVPPGMGAELLVRYGEALPTTAVASIDASFPGYQWIGSTNVEDALKEVVDDLADTTNPANGAALVGFKQAGTGAVARTVQDKLRDVIYSADYSTLQQAINAAYGKTLVVTGAHAITDALAITDSIEIILDENAIIDYSGAAAGASLAEKRAIEITGSIAAPVSVTADVAVGASQIAVSSTATFAVGDWITLRSDEQFMTGVTATGINRGHIARIKSVDSATLLTLTMPSPFAYASASNARIEKITTIKDVTIRGAGRIVGGGVGKAHNGIYAYAAERLTVQGVRIEDCEDCGVRTSYCISPSVQYCDISGSTSPGGSVGNTGYGVGFFDGTVDGKVIRNRLRNCRHGVAGGSGIISMDCLVAYNYTEDCGIGTHALDCHEPCYWWQFIGNTIRGGAGGIVVRGQYTTVYRNTIQGTSGSAIRVRQFLTVNAGVYGTKILHNDIYSCGSGIILEGASTSDRIIDAIVALNKVSTVGLYGVAGLYVSNVDIAHNEIDTITSNTGSEGSAIRITGASLGDSADVEIRGNRLRNTLRHGVFAQFVQGLSVSDNRIGQVATAVAGSCISAQQCADVEITGGRSYGDLVGNGAVVNIDRCDRVTINGHRMKGNTANATQDGVRAFNGSGTSDAISMTGCIITGCGRHAFFSSNTDRVLVVGNNVRDVFSATKINISGATTSVNANNITT